MLQIGQPAPGFALTDSNGSEVCLQQFRGQWVALWWYPEANSSGCSVQAASIERSKEDFAAEGVVVLGASFNSVDENVDFACDKSLGLILLSDPERVAGTAYGVVRDPDDRHPTKPHRHTYIVDPDGLVAYAEDANEVDLGNYGPHLLKQVRAARAAATAG